MTPSEEFDLMYTACKALGYKEASKHLGLTRHQLYGRIKKVYPDFKVDTKQGERKWYAEDLAEMFEMQADGKTGQEIADLFKIERRTVYVIFYQAKKHGFDLYPKKVYQNQWGVEL